MSRAWQNYAATISLNNESIANIFQIFLSLCTCILHVFMRCPTKTYAESVAESTGNYMGMYQA